MKKRIIPLLLIMSLALYSSVTANASTNQNTYTEIDNYLQKSVKSTNIPGMSVIIIDKDSVLFSNTYGNCNSIDTPFIIGSMSKSFTAVSIMRLVEQDKINLDSNVSAYLPDVSVGSKITVRQLLNQTSGLGEYQRLSSMKITDSYGKHQYANVNYNVLGKIIESVSGMSYEEYVTQNIFDPLKMNHSAASLDRSKENGLISGYRNYFGITIAGEPDYPDENSWSQVPAGYITSSASDMGKYLQMYLNDGEKVITPESIDTVFYNNVLVESNVPYYYGMGWTLSKGYDEPILGHSGLVENYMSNMFILPESGIGVVILANTNDILVTNSMFDSISGSIVLMLLGDTPVEIGHIKYLTSHLLIDAIYFIILFVALLPIFLLKRYKKKLTTKKTSRTIAKIGIFYLVLPTILLLFTSFLGIPLWAVRYFVPDLFIILITSATLLYTGGAIKVILLYKEKTRKHTTELI